MHRRYRCSTCTNTCTNIHPLLYARTHTQPGETGEQFDKSNKYFVTFPYPYMNGRLHLGHTFTISKVNTYVLECIVLFCVSIPLSPHCLTGYVVFSLDTDWGNVLCAVLSSCQGFLSHLYVSLYFSLLLGINVWRGNDVFILLPSTALGCPLRYASY